MAITHLFLTVRSKTHKPYKYLNKYVHLKVSKYSLKQTTKKKVFSEKTKNSLYGS